MSKFKELYKEILLEKDHRVSMIKFGIPKEVAEYLHSISDKYSIWFANQFKQMPDFQNASNKINFIRDRVNTMRGIIDWVSNYPNIMLKSYNWEEAIEASQKWHDSLESSKLEGIEKNKIIKKYNDGFYWVDLESTRCSSEGDLMGHCGTTHKAETIFSLRRYDKATNTIEGFISMAISPNDHIWYQCKGKKNSKPKKEYFPYIIDILIDNNTFEYTSEYNKQNDFNINDFKNYVEDNSDKYENYDEIINKLEESGLVAQAEKLFNEYEFKNIFIDYNIEGDEEDYIWANGYTGITLNNDEMPEIIDLRNYLKYKENDQDGIYNHKLLLEVIKEALDKMNIYIDSEDFSIYNENIIFEEKDFKLYMNINFSFLNQNEYYAYNSADEELDKFKNFLNDMSNYDNILNYKDFKKKFIEYFREKLLESELLEADQIEKPRMKLEDPRQLKFPNFESKYFNKLYSMIIKENKK